MLILRACLLWSVISINILGAALLFRRWFPRESPWFAFIVPGIFLVVVSNFVEHLVALTFLRWLLLPGTLGSFWLILTSHRRWRVMRLPTLIFLGSFAFTLLLRMLRPSIPHARDGIADLALISNFCFGQTLPVESTWLPPVKLLHYYCLEHYGGALLIRYLGIDLGTGYNLCAALLSAFIYFLTGAVAWHIGRRVWITILAVALTACAATGSVGFLMFSVRDLVPEDVVNIYGQRGLPESHLWLWKYLDPIDDIYARHELLVPGFWSWVGAFHSSAVGQLLIGFALLSLIETMRRKRTNLPWICLAISSLLMLTCCSWGVPFTGLLTLAGLFVCWRRGNGPENWRVVLMGIALVTMCLEPMLSYMLVWAAPGLDWATGLHTQLTEFLVQWWPVFLPWLALFFVWKRLHAATRIMLILGPIFFAMVETFNIGQRYDMTGKLWGMIFGAAGMTFLPALARQRGWGFRLLLAVLIVNGLLSLDYWRGYYLREARLEDLGHLEGTGPLHWDMKKALILQALAPLQDQTILCGKSEWIDCECALLAHLTSNRVYVTWSVICDDGFYTNGLGEAYRREVPVNDLYDGKNPDPLTYLRQRDIAALVIYPDDNITDAVVAKLQQQLAPYYSYEDYRDGDTTKIPPNAGVFLFRPAIRTLVGPPPVK